MQTVSKLDQKHADIIGNREQKLAQIFCRTLVLGLGFNFRQLSDAINQARHFRAKAAFDIFDRGQRIFNRVMQQRGDYRVLIHFEVSHQASNLYGMAEIGITRRTFLRPMHLNREDIRPIQPIFIDVRRISPHPFNQFILPHHKSKLGLLRCDATVKLIHTHSCSVRPRKRSGKSYNGRDKERGSGCQREAGAQQKCAGRIVPPAQSFFGSTNCTKRAAMG